MARFTFVQINDTHACFDIHQEIILKTILKEKF